MRGMVDVLLWDLCDTLIDGRWMHKAPEGCPGWPTIWTNALRDRGQDWDAGRLTEPEFIGELARETGMQASAVEEHFAACCRSIKFHPAAWRAAKERRRPQAIVTVISDLFADRIEKPYGLEAHFDSIIASYREGTNDKTELCLIALDRLGYHGPRSRALLIDDRSDLTEAWTVSGGSAYHFRDDSSFASDWLDMFR
jgi:FMN phosphatase YigB (HAD superfamily)